MKHTRKINNTRWNVSGMTNIRTAVSRSFKRSGLLAGASLFLTALSVGTASPVYAQSTTPAATVCTTSTAPATTYGQVKQTVSVPTAGTYRVWVRIKAPDTTNNAFYFQADGDNSCNMGDLATMPANAWTWVSYRSGDTTTAGIVYKTLTAGSHTLTYTGREPGVELDRVLLLGDTACVPTGTGDNCAVADTTSPTVSISSPAAAATVSGTTTISATAADANGVTKVEFYADGTIIGTADTTTPYSASWDTTKATAGTHTLTAKAYDPSGNVGTSSGVSVTVKNTTTDVTPPTAPTALTSTAKTSTSVSLSWGASTDATGVTGYRVFRGTTQVGTPTTTTYTDTGLTANTAYSYTVKAIDAAGNLSTASTALSVTTSAGTTTDSTPPTVSITAPASGASITSGTATAFSATASDNVGVTKVEFYDGTTLLTTSTTGTSGVYKYTWTPTTAGAHSLKTIAYDAAGNSTTSTVISVTVSGGTTSTQGDVNGDGRVNALDLSALISHDGQNYPAADFNKDGTVGAADMAILLSKWTW